MRNDEKLSFIEIQVKIDDKTNQIMFRINDIIIESPSRTYISRKLLKEIQWCNKFNGLFVCLYPFAVVF